MPSRAAGWIAGTLLLLAPLVGLAASAVSTRAAPLGAASEFFDELPAALLPGGPMPEYPQSLRESGEGARVVLSLVVLPDGQVDTTRVRVLLGDSAVVTAVRAILPSLRYTPRRLVSARTPCAIFNGSVRVCEAPGKQVERVASPEILVVDLPPYVER